MSLLLVHSPASTGGPFCTKNAPDSWMRLDFGTNCKLQLEHYSMRCYQGQGTPDNWELQGAMAPKGP